MAFLSEPQIDPICVIRCIRIICGSESLPPMPHLSEPQIILMKMMTQMTRICVIPCIRIICGSENLSEPQIILMGMMTADDPYLRHPMHPDDLRFRKLVADAAFVRTADHLDENDDRR